MKKKLIIVGLIAIAAWLIWDHRPEAPCGWTRDWQEYRDCG